MASPRNLRLKDGRTATFNKAAFCHAFKSKALREKIHKGDLYLQLAETLHMNDDSIKTWAKPKRGGPANEDLVIQLAKALDLPDYTLLLNFTDGGTPMEKLTDRQKDAAKRIYDICIWFLDEFNHSNGFNDYWFQFADAGSNDPKEDILEKVETMWRKVELVLDQEYFDLHGCDIYDDLCEFIYEDLINTYDGKLDYAYRFEARVDGNPTTYEDYDRAMIRLNTIIETYV